MADHFSLRWNNYHRNMSAGFHTLLMEGSLVDVTLAAEGRFVQAHRLVLSVCSPYFKNLFSATRSNHPIVIMKDVRFKHLTDVLSFMYQGEVSVHQEELSDFLKTAEILQIRGLAESRCHVESSLHPTVTRTSTQNQQKPQNMMNHMVQIATDFNTCIPLLESSSVDKVPSPSLRDAHNLKQSSQNTPVYMDSTSSRQETSSPVFAVPLKEELVDEESNGPDVIDLCEYLPSEVQVENTAGESSERLEIRERKEVQRLVSAAPERAAAHAGMKKPTPGNRSYGGQREVSVSEQMKCKRSRKQRRIALQKIKCCLIAPKRSKRLRQQIRKPFIKSSLSTENVSYIPEALSAWPDSLGLS